MSLSLEFPFPESFGEHNDLVDAYLNSTLHGFWKVSVTVEHI